MFWIFECFIQKKGVSLFICNFLWMTVCLSWRLLHLSRCYFVTCMFVVKRNQSFWNAIKKKIYDDVKPLFDLKTISPETDGPEQPRNTTRNKANSTAKLQELMTGGGGGFRKGPNCTRATLITKNIKETQRNTDKPKGDWKPGKKTPSHCIFYCTCNFTVML